MTTERNKERASVAGRKVLQWLVDQGGEGIVSSGYKSTHFGRTRKDKTPAAATSINVLSVLRRNGWIVPILDAKDPRSNRYRITEQGKHAAGGAKA